MANEKKILPENWHAPMSYSEFQKIKRMKSFPFVDTPKKMGANVDPMDPKYLLKEVGGTRKRTKEEEEERKAHNIHAQKTNI